MFSKRNWFSKVALHSMEATILTGRIESHSNVFNGTIANRFLNVAHSFSTITSGGRVLKEPIPLPLKHVNKRSLLKFDYSKLIIKRDFSSVARIYHNDVPKSLALVNQTGILAHIVYENNRKRNPKIVIREVDSQKELITLVGPQTPIADLSFSANGNLLVAVANLDQKIYIWDLSQLKKEPIRVIPHMGTEPLLYCNSDATLFAIAYKNNLDVKFGLQVIKVTGNNVVNFELAGYDRLKYTSKPVQGLKLMPDDSTLVISQNDPKNGGMLSFFSINDLVPEKTNLPNQVMKCDGLDAPRTLVFDEALQRLAGSANSNTFPTVGFILELAGKDKGKIKKFGIPGDEYSNSLALAFSPDGKMLASGGMYLNAKKHEKRSVIRLWDFEGNLINKDQILDPNTPGYLGQLGRSTEFVMFPDKLRIISVDSQGAIRECDVNGKRGAEKVDYKSPYKIAFSYPKMREADPSLEVPDEKSFLRLKTKLGITS